jgi:hypothetical protein
MQGKKEEALAVSNEFGRVFSFPLSEMGKRKSEESTRPNGFWPIKFGKNKMG